MIPEIVIISVLLVLCNGLSIGTVSEHNVNQSETSIGDVFPDWVPFKNKHGDELGEFVPVVTKNKVKKRLAPPVHFILKSVAEPEGDEYYDKGQGESDNEDTYESKDWSDVNRLAEAVDVHKKVNHTDLSGIKDVLDILTKKPESSIADAKNNTHNIKNVVLINEPKNSEEEEEEEEEEEDDEDETTTEIPTAADSKIAQNKEKESEENVNYDEENSEKQKADHAKDVSESEAKKAKILDSVDELKQRHAEEARSISEKVKEEELYKEEFERNRLHPLEVKDKYGSRYKYKKTTPDYDEYDDKYASLEDKYRVRPLRRETTTRKAHRTTKLNNLKNEPGKLSVFRNPSLYMIYDDSEETTTSHPKKGKQKFSSRYTTVPPSDSDEDRISLLPEESKEGEPTLFFPKKRKSRRRKVKTSTTASDSVEEITTVYPKLVAALDTTASDTKLTDTTVETAPSAIGSEESAPGTDTTGTGSDVTASGPSELSVDESTGSNVANIDSVSDAVPASSDHKKEEKKKNTDYHHEKGGGKEHDSEYSEEHEEHGKKAYKGHHEDTKKAVGHKDKENHLEKYDDHGGVDKHHSEESGHYGDQHHEEHGKKHAKYEESGKHSKGHSTKGSHDIHKKEEYEKNVEFFEEEGDSAEEEKHGGFKKEKGHSEGGQFKKGNLKAGHEHHSKGEAGQFAKGGHTHLHKSHKQASGNDSHGKHGGNHFHKDGQAGGKKWVYHHGFPAKTANLVVIDRRGDQLFHGPGYYG